MKKKPTTTMYDDTFTTHANLTTAEAHALLAKLRHYKVANRKDGKLTNRVERAFFVAAHVNLPIADKPDHHFPGYTNVRVDYQRAVAYVTETLRYLEKRGARINVKSSDTCVFVG
jgi:hypothetical protein